MAYIQSTGPEYTLALLMVTSFATNSFEIILLLFNQMQSITCSKGKYWKRFHWPKYFQSDNIYLVE